MKVTNSQSLSYPFQLVPSPNTSCFAWNSEYIPQLRTCQNSFFPLTIKERNNLNPKIIKSKRISIFKSNILKFIPPKPNNLYYCHNPKGFRVLTRLGLDLSHLREHKFKYSFHNFLNTLYICSNDTETSAHYLLHYSTYKNEGRTLLEKIKNINCGILEITLLVFNLIPSF